MSFFSSSWCRWLAAVCDSGTLWSFLLAVFFLFFFFEIFRETGIIRILDFEKGKDGPVCLFLKVDETAMIRNRIPHSCLDTKGKVCGIIDV